MEGVPDWRIGLKATPKMRDHPFFGKWALIVGSRPETTNLNGVLILETLDGARFEALADDWKTA